MMKKIVAIIFLSIAFFNVYAQNIFGNTYTDTLTYLLNAGNNNFDELYDGVIPVNKYGTETNYIDVDKYLSSSYAYLISLSHNDFPDYAKSQLRINYSESSNLLKSASADKIRNEIKLAFKTFENLPEYKIAKGSVFKKYTKNIYLTKNGRLIASYHDKRKGNIYTYNRNDEGDFCLIIYEQPRTKTLADESTYNGVFPSTIKKSNMPQIWEQKQIDNNSSKINRWNGIFTSTGLLKAGTKTYHGYRSFYNGTWYSDNWEYGNVRFTPEGTNNTICGNFFTQTLDEFVVNDFYVDKFKDATDDNPYQKLTKYSYQTDYNCEWMKHVYPAFSIKRDSVAQAKNIERNRILKDDEETYVAKPTLAGKYPCTKCERTGKIITRIVMEGEKKVQYYKICDKCGGSGSSDY